MKKPLSLEIDDYDADGSMSMTWSFDAEGNMRHKPTNTMVSTDRGITFEGHEYQLCPEDIILGGTAVGSGYGGLVQKGIVKGGGSSVAVKTIRMDDKVKRDQLLSEIRGLTQAAGCPNLVQWYAAFASKKTSAVHVVMEFMDLGSLADLTYRLCGNGVPSPHLSCVVMQVARGLEHLHSRRLMHRDIKPHNILHNCLGEVKLTDFGITKVMEDRMSRTLSVVGTQTYMSPERCKGLGYTLKSDIWSVGMVVYEIAMGRYPFPDVSSFIELYDYLCQQPEPRLDPVRFPLPLCDFVECCLTRDVSERPEMDVLVKHAFVSQNVGTPEDFAMWLATIAP
mmetsp:Transcript_96284/g.272171  ORF Transcript_96284/g.272171 Transcript_96284/m.272171 type:complete len:337 (-) Transcript_96284:79-1089(-)